MNNVTLMGLIASSVAEAGQRGIPAGHVYAAIMGSVSHAEFSAAVNGLVRCDMVTSYHHLLQITERGKKFAATFDQILAQAKTA